MLMATIHEKPMKELALKCSTVDLKNNIRNNALLFFSNILEMCLNKELFFI